MKALEFYSGIGGLHLALSRSHSPAVITHAFDWDQIACEVYSANFGSGIARKLDITALTASYLAALEASVWLLSPACQPYTVLNPSAKAELDPRARSFLHLVQTVLPELARNNSHPSHLFIENVAGFETSTTRKILVTTLRNLGYVAVEFLLTPLQFGIPNSRLRYYLLAKRAPFHFRDIGNENDADPFRYIPGRGSPWIDPRSAEPSIRVEEIRQYLDPEAENGSYAIPDKILRKWGRLLTLFFHLLDGLVVLRETTSIFNMFLRAQSSSDDGVATESVRTLDCLRLRYFSPEELLRLFSFTPLDSRTPSTQPFIWSDGVSRKTKYRLIGNSVNVRVVQELLSFLFEEP